MSPLMTTREVAELLRVSPATVLRWAQAGKLPSVRLSSAVLRFDADELDAALRERATPSRGVSPAPKDAARALPYPLSPAPAEVEEI